MDERRETWDEIKVRDLFPSRPAPRGGISYPVRAEFIAPVVRERRRSRVASMRAWWRAHWWPARIRCLEAEIERLEEDHYFGTG